MTDNIIWVYNGWALLITALAPIYTVAQAKLSTLRFLLRKVFPLFFLASIGSLLFLSHWLTVVLYIPAWFLGIAIMNGIEALLGVRNWRDI